MAKWNAFSQLLQENEFNICLIWTFIHLWNISQNNKFITAISTRPTTSWLVINQRCFPHCFTKLKMSFKLWMIKKYSLEDNKTFKNETLNILFLFLDAYLSWGAQYNWEGKTLKRKITNNWGIHIIIIEYTAAVILHRR